jgi:hypothetical protein
VQRILWKIVSVDFDVTGQVLITYSAFNKTVLKWEDNEAMKDLFIHFKKPYDSITRETFYDVFIKMCFLLKIVRLLKIELVTFLIRIGLK